MSDREFDETIWGSAPLEDDFMRKDDNKKNKKDKKKKDKKKKSKIFLIIIAFILLFCAFAYAGYLVSNEFLSDGTAGFEQNEEKSEDNKLAADDEKREAILILGVDRRENEACRSDTIMLAFMDKQKPSVTLLSIPRDTCAQVSGHGQTKINHAYAYGGSDLILKTVNDLFDLKVEKYIVADFQGFANIVDILGGIKYNVEKRMYYPEEGIDLMAGDQHLNGDKALQYVRYRSDGQGDIGRVARQQKFLKVFADKSLQISTVWKVPDLVKEASKSIDTNIAVTEMITLANSFKNIDTAEIKVVTLPGTSSNINEVSYWVPETTELDNIL